MKHVKQLKLNETKQILVRIGCGDVIVTQEQSEKLTGYAVLLDEDGNIIKETETFFVSYEDEDGNEVDANGDTKKW